MFPMTILEENSYMFAPGFSLLHVYLILSDIALSSFSIIGFMMSLLGPPSESVNLHSFLRALQLREQ